MTDKIFLQHGEMGKEGRIIEIFCFRLAASDTCLTLDADPDNLRRIFRRNRTQRANPRTFAATAAFVRICLWFCLQEDRWLAIHTFRHIIGRSGIAVYFHSRRAPFQIPDFRRNISGETRYLFQIFFVRSSRSQLFCFRM